MLKLRDSASPTREYPQEQGRDKLNADWAAAALFDVASRFDADHKQALLVAIRKNGLANAYTIVLFDDSEQVKRESTATSPHWRSCPDDSLGGEIRRPRLD